MRLRDLVNRALIAFIMALWLTGCGGPKGPDASMTTSPSGLWVGKTDPDLIVDIQEGGLIKITDRQGERNGKWRPQGTQAIQAEFSGQSYELAFSRKDLELTLTLPGQTEPSTFTQM